VIFRPVPNQLKARAFTLIELLVVIAIIGLLVSLLLPALGKAKKAALMARSLSNIRQQSTSAAAYQDDYKRYMPLMLAYTRGGTAVAGVQLEGWCTWSYGGKNNSARWGMQTFDIEAADRPLNPYITTEIIDGPAFPTRMQAADPVRGIFELEVFKDPSDKIGHQFAWPNENSDGKTCYDDVGTSYQYNVKWWDQIYGRPPIGGNFVRAFNAGTARMAIADTFQPSRFVWMHDEYADLVVNSPATYRLKNGYDDINRSLMGFMDGHAAYHHVIPGNSQQSYEQPNYTFIFNDLRLQ
jgi:prepilin-type N-terminal cleavage/methylation domain-containing protein